MDNGSHGRPPSCEGPTHSSEAFRTHVVSSSTATTSAAPSNGFMRFGALPTLAPTAVAMQEGLRDYLGPGGSRILPVQQALRHAQPTSQADATNSSKRTRKDRGPNWSPQEVAALIQAKRDLFFEELDAKDGRELMKTEASKWARISVQVMKAGFSSFARDGHSCKAKWSLLNTDYRRVADFFARSGSNGPDYWSMNASERKAENLPRSFPEEVFYGIHYWLGNRPSMAPPHSRDLLSAEDSNYLSANEGPNTVEDEAAVDPQAEHVVHAAFQTSEHSEETRSAFSPISVPSQSELPPNSEPALRSRSTCPTSRRFTSLPEGVTPVDLCSSETIDSAAHNRPGNTGVRRKNLTGHTVIAEATKATGAVMAEQMKNMADASQQLERTKLEAQRKLFEEQMEYQRKRDRRLQENARVANENAKLAIMKQGEVVQCLATLAQVLTGRLQQPEARHAVPGTPQSMPPPAQDEPGTTYAPKSK